MKIIVIAGSSRKDSLTARVALHLQNKLVAGTAHEIELIDMRDWQLPFVEQVFRKVEDAPESIRPLAASMLSADAFIIVTPEYNGSYTSAVKNLLDHFPKQTHKSFGLVTASPGLLGGARASQQLLLLVPALFGIASPYLLMVPEVDKKFAEDGSLLVDGFEKQVNLFLNEFLWLAERVADEEKVSVLK